jgi:TolB-like protein
VDEQQPRLYEFGEFQLDAGRGVLRSSRDGKPLELTSKALSTLLYLLEHAGQVVEKGALFAAVWPNVVVEEGNLTQTVHVLRRALGEHPDDHRFIVTVPRRGYRFVADVRRETRAVATPRPIHSIAVLPFTDLSPEGDNDYFSDGLSEEVVNFLAQSPDLQVTARTSSFSFRNQSVDIATIAEKLNVRYVVEGSVREVGKRVRITVQLVEASSSSYVWSHTYERDVDDAFAVQAEIAAAVVQALRAHLANRTGAERAALIDLS